MGALPPAQGELGELFLWRSPSEVTQALASDDYRARVASEMADVLIFLLYLSEATGLDLAEAVLTKIKENAERYPVHLARGRARKYNELADSVEEPG